MCESNQSLIQIRDFDARAIPYASMRQPREKAVKPRPTLLREYCESVASHETRPMACKQLYTVGYEGAEIADFLATIGKLGIRQIIDVRELPLSRKRGFSKNILADALRRAGIDYLHFKELGDPKPGREAARAGDYAAFRKIYHQHLKKTETQLALAAAAKAAARRTSCLLCFERDPVNCHRTIISDALSQNWDFNVSHIGIRQDLKLPQKKIDHDLDRHRQRAVG